MITLKKIYLEPEKIDAFKFEPISFERGINVILGESSVDTNTSAETKKMNGVGKSMLIQIIEFCLLNDLTKNRLSKLPIDLIDDRAFFCLDLEYEDASGRTRISTVNGK